MARIRIVDEWLRSPVSAPARKRAIMVVARTWAEQRVLMRAFAASDDQTRPTINLHGSEYAIGPAGTDPHGEWGIHVEPPVDGRAQELREALQLAARVLAGSKGNPPRLQDEVPEEEDRATLPYLGRKESGDSNVGARTVFGHSQQSGGFYEPVEGAAMSSSRVIPSSSSARLAEEHKKKLRQTPVLWGREHDAPKAAESVPPPEAVLERGAQPALAVPSSKPVSERKRKLRDTFRYSGALPTQRSESTGGGGGSAPKKGASKTVFGYPSGDPKESLGALAGKTMPIGLTLDVHERTVLDALGRSPCLTATEIGRLLAVDDPLTWMSNFLDKLADFGLDLVVPGEDRAGEPTYVLTR